MISRKNVTALLEEHGMNAECIDLTPKVEVCAQSGIAACWGYCGTVCVCVCLCVCVCVCVCVCK